MIKKKMLVLCAITAILLCIFSLRKRITNSTSGAVYLDLEGENVMFPFKCSTCALVGYSGHLKRSGLGPSIDRSHSCVFRLGFSPTEEYAEDVGSRTTARIVDSYRFYPYVKKPSKLTKRTTSSEFWFIFDWKPGDITRLHGPALKTDKLDSRFYWFSRPSERDIRESLRNRTNASRGVSALWFAAKVTEDSNCDTLNVYGVTQPYICKKNFNLSLPSLYWEESSVDVCRDGIDSSYSLINNPTPLLPTPLERKAFYSWAHETFQSFRFYAPDW